YHSNCPSSGLLYQTSPSLGSVFQLHCKYSSCLLHSWSLLGSSENLIFFFSGIGGSWSSSPRTSTPLPFLALSTPYLPSFLLFVSASVLSRSRHGLTLSSGLEPHLQLQEVIRQLF